MSYKNKIFKEKSLLWFLVQEEKTIEVKLNYNVYLGGRTLYIEGEKAILIKNLALKNMVSFEYNEKKYNIELIPEDYGYYGYLGTESGEKILSQIESKDYEKMPLWILPFLLINMSIPIIAVEALTPWCIGVLTSYLAIRVAKKTLLDGKRKVATIVGISVLAWGLHYIFYLVVKPVGFLGGFIPF